MGRREERQVRWGRECEKWGTYGHVEAGEVGEDLGDLETGRACCGHCLAEVRDMWFSQGS